MKRRKFFQAVAALSGAAIIRPTKAESRPGDVGLDPGASSEIEPVDLSRLELDRSTPAGYYQNFHQHEVSSTTSSSWVIKHYHRLKIKRGFNLLRVSYELACSKWNAHALAIAEARIRLNDKVIQTRMRLPDDKFELFSLSRVICLDTFLNDMAEIYIDWRLAGAFGTAYIRNAVSQCIRL